MKHLSLSAMSLLAALTALAVLTGCAPKPGLPEFHQVEADLFRGNQPQTMSDYMVLHDRGVRTILKLNTENLDQEREAAHELGMTLIEVPLSGIWAPGEADELRVQAAIRNPALRPLYFHCEQGKDRTGLAAAIYRIQVEHWPFKQANDEWYADGHSWTLFTMDGFLRRLVGEQ